MESGEGGVYVDKGRQEGERQEKARGKEEGKKGNCWKQRAREECEKDERDRRRVKEDAEGKAIPCGIAAWKSKSL